MSIAILQYGLVPLIVDLSSTHARHPKWPKHARFHVVTQALTGSAIAAVAMYLLWSPKIQPGMGVCLAMVLSFCVLGAFFVSAAFRSLYGGSLSDEEGGVENKFGIDLNLLNFGFAGVLLVAGRLLLL